MISGLLEIRVNGNVLGSRRVASNTMLSIDSCKVNYELIMEGLGRPFILFGRQGQAHGQVIRLLDWIA